MEEEIRIPLIKDDGTIYWALPREVPELTKPGREAGEMREWKGPPPKDRYYPNFDKKGGSINISAFYELSEGDEILPVEVI